MEILVNQKQLSAVLKKIKSATGTQMSINAIEGIKFSAQDGKLEVTGTDMEIGMTSTLDCEGEGEFIVPRDVAEIVNKMPAGNISLKVESAEGSRDIIVSSTEKKTSFNLGYLADIEQFPTLPHPSGSTIISIDGDVLYHALKKVENFISTDTTRPSLTGAYIEAVPSENKVKFTSTDTRRLSHYEVEAPVDSEGAWIIPKTAIALIRRECQGQKELAMQLGDKDARIEMQSMTITSRIIDGQFPNYPQFFPKENKIEFRVDKSELVSALGRLMVISDTAIMDIQDDVAVITAQDDNGRSAREEISVNSNEPIRLGFNAQYFRQAVEVYEADEITFQTNGTVEPIVMPEYNGYSHILMPIRIESESGRYIAGTYSDEISYEEDEAIARRIVACVNACRGIPTDLLEEKTLPEALGRKLARQLASDLFSGEKGDEHNAPQNIPQ